MDDKIRLEKAREFCSRVRELADEFELPFFVVTEGASSTSNNGSEAVKNARDNHIEWESKHGFDPYEDWSKEEQKNSASLNEEVDSAKKKIFNETHKFVAVVNKDLEIGKCLNAIAHSCAGLVNLASSDECDKMSFVDFVDKDGLVHANISGLSLIVLRGKNGEIKNLRNKFVENNILFTDFTESMTGDTYKEQLEKTANLSSDDMKYYCIAAFGEKSLIDPLTKKFSLWH